MTDCWNKQDRNTKITLKTGEVLKMSIKIGQKLINRVKIDFFNDQFIQYDFWKLILNFGKIDIDSFCHKRENTE